MRKAIDSVDLVVFSAPQLSLVEMRQVAELLDGKRATIPLLAVTSPQVKPDADRMGLTARIEAAGGTVLAGMCFYQSYAREMAEANGWKRLATNSAKLTNILGGYGYKPALLSMEQCVAAACAGGQARMSQIFHASAGMGTQAARPGRWSPRTASRRATTSTASRACSRGPSTSSPAKAMSAACWCSMPPRAASPPPGCCTRCRRAA